MKNLKPASTVSVTWLHKRLNSKLCPPKNIQNIFHWPLATHVHRAMVAKPIRSVNDVRKPMACDHGQNNHCDGDLKLALLLITSTGTQELPHILHTKSAWFTGLERPLRPPAREGLPRKRPFQEDHLSRHHTCVQQRPHPLLGTACPIDHSYVSARELVLRMSSMMESGPASIGAIALDAISNIGDSCGRPSKTSKLDNSETQNEVENESRR